MVQNKLHFTAHGHTESEVIYLRVDSDKPFAGVTNFKGDDPTKAEVEDLNRLLDNMGRHKLTERFFNFC